MTTNLQNTAGTDFDSLFERGSGDQLLNIYASDGTDIGQRYLNVSNGSQVSANTGFQVSSGADVRTKLCGLGTGKIYYTLSLTSNGDWPRLTLTLSNIPSGGSVSCKGYFELASTYTDREGSSTSNSTKSVNLSFGNETKTLWFDKGVNTTWRIGTIHLTLTFNSRSTTIDVSGASSSGSF